MRIGTLAIVWGLMPEESKSGERLSQGDFDSFQRPAVQSPFRARNGHARRIPGATMAIQFYNTLTRQKEIFEPIEPGKVGLYTCGPTVYNFAHIGNLRTFTFEDLLRRHLEYRGYAVRHVKNITDVEDKIIRTCRETGESLKALTTRFFDAFLQDIDAIGLLRATEYPRATDHINDIVALIQTLLEKGYAYESDGSVYFRLGAFKDYGKLSHHDLDALKTGASGRVDSDEYATEDARDFALWKAWDEEDGPVFWETAIGKGRPGWHIECSAMSTKSLGPTFDIHSGGIDLMFPHHENEIAQSEAATGKPFVRYWLHCEHLIVEGRKMSKSLNNFFTLRDLLDRGYDPTALRYVLISTHYRQRLNFSFDAIEAAKETLHRVRDFRLRLRAVTGEGSDLIEETAQREAQFAAALDDDLNIAEAMAAVFDFIRDTNKLIDQNGVSLQGAANAETMLDRLDTVVGVFGMPAEEAPEDVQALALERQAARRAKDFKRADAIRDELAASGWIIEDTPDGPRLKRV